MEPINEDSGKTLEKNNQNKITDALVSCTDFDDETDDFYVITNDFEDPKNKDWIFHKEPYKILSQEDIQENHERDIAYISDFLSIRKAEAALLLIHCNWCINTVIDRWFTNEEKLRNELGLSGSWFLKVHETQVTCRKCYLTFSQEQVAVAPCGYICCKPCWADHTRISLENGRTTIMLKCPDSYCKITVDQDMINMLAKDDDKELYARDILRSYVDYNPKARWCPNPGCNNAMILYDDIDTYSKVTCNCSYSFCWKCSKEAHLPISCQTATNWARESLKQSKNWLLTNIKSCPNCWIPFEEDDRFKRVECKSCKSQFCRLCFSSWLDCGFWKDDQYIHMCTEGKQKGITIMDENDRQKQRKEAEESWTRYKATASLWRAQDMHLQEALKEFQALKNGRLQAVAYKQLRNEAEFGFVTEAWLQIANCKRFLKWLCIHLYYLPRTDDQIQTRFLIDYLHRRAEIVLEQLYHNTYELNDFFAQRETPARFSQFPNSLSLMTRMAKNFFDNMAWAIENGESNPFHLRKKMRSRMMKLVVGTPIAAEENREGERQWTCTLCHIPNEDTSICVMCYQ